MKPIRCYAGQFFGGYPVKTKDAKDSSRAQLVGIKLILDSTTADTATELELEDWNALQSTVYRPRRTYQQSRVNRLFRHKASSDDSAHFFDFNNAPLDCQDGIKIRTNTNCRPAFYVR